MGLGGMTSLYSLTRTCTKPNNNLVSVLWEHFWCQDDTQAKLELTRLTMARTWGKPPPSPLQYTLRLSMKPTSKWFFCHGTLTEIAKVETFATLRGYNFVCKPPIRMQSKAKSYFVCKPPIEMRSKTKSYFMCKPPIGMRFKAKLYFVCKPPIGMRFKAKSQPSSRAFQICFAHHLHTKKSSQFLIFSGRESNCQFDYRPFF